MNWLEPRMSEIGPELALLGVLALVISSIGFYRVVYFISIGYALSIVAMCTAAPLRHVEGLGVASVLQNVLLALWGIRLGLYLVRREASPSFRKEIAGVHERTAGMKLVIKVLIWVSVSLLYVLMYSPALFAVAAVETVRPWSAMVVQWAGVAVMAGGLILESVADWQKALYKAVNPGRFCDTGLYRWVRCPNYLGEILVWLGNWVAGAVFLQSPLAWTLSLVGLVCIVLIMIGSTKRLERTQQERYGSVPEYQTYIKTVPVLFPFVPVYSLKNVRVYLE